ncbi:serine/threonine-protein kinase [Archangium sp.]|uniref:serine/threonine-protein kinase n=1 Tax=Archangium sp. TaxID=1872627 RepID=UPI00286B5FAB|nr:serine/threonine-protein kinase [Archangium sp.]
MGKRDDYALENVPFSGGGYANVYKARRKSDGLLVAFKRNRNRMDYESNKRLKREIEALQKLKHTNIIQILDWDEQGEWYTMPLAAGNLEQMRRTLSEEGVKRAIEQAAVGLGFAHAQNYVHRDVTPRNILAIDDRGDDSHWVVADWGLVRRPPGQTSVPLTSGVLGTEGFFAPEVWTEGGQAADKRADVYGLGRVAAWATTGLWPIPNVDLLPEGRWRIFVRRATAAKADDRPEDMAKLVELLKTTVEDVVPASDDFVELLKRSREGDKAALSQVVDFALENAEDGEIYMKHICYLGKNQLEALVENSPDKLVLLVRQMAVHLRGDFRGFDFDHANTLINWMQRAAEAAVTKSRFNVLSDICESWFPEEIRWDRWQQVKKSRDFLRTLRGDAAQTVARVLRATDGAAEYYRGEESWLNASPAIRDVLKKR